MQRQPAKRLSLGKRRKFSFDALEEPMRNIAGDGLSLFGNLPEQTSDGVFKPHKI